MRDKGLDGYRRDHYLAPVKSHSMLNLSPLDGWCLFTWSMNRLTTYLLVRKRELKSLNVRFISAFI